MDFSEACLLEATLNIHTHALIFSLLSVASVDDKQHLSEVVLSALVGFQCMENDGFRVVPVHSGLVTSDYGVHEVGVSI